MWYENKPDFKLWNILIISQDFNSDIWVDFLLDMK